MEVSFYLKRADSVEPTAIYARISYYGLQLKYYPSIKINPKFWNKETQGARETIKLVGYSNFNRRLDDVTREIEDTILQYQNSNDNEIPSASDLKKLLDLRLKDISTKKDKLTFVTYFDKFIADSQKGVRVNVSSKKPITQGTVKTYIVTRNILKDFITFTKSKIDFDNIDLDFYGDFTAYLQAKRLQSINSVGKHIKIIKTIMNEAIEDGLTTNAAYKSKRFVSVQEKADTIYLTESELLKLWKLDLTDEPKLERVRDLFLVGCYTGLRYSDFSVLHPDQIKDGYIETTQKKTGDPVVIPVYHIVDKIVSKYVGVLPRSISNQKTNEYIKEVAKKVPELKNELVSISYTKGGQKITQNIAKYELISTHTARRSFATNEFKAGTPSITIMAITGHKTEKAFLKYIKVTPKEHAQILKLAWEKRAKGKLIPLSA